MNEKELLKKVSDKEFSSRGSALSAAEVLGISVSTRAKVRTGYWKTGLAFIGAAAIAAGVAVILNRSEIPKDDIIQADSIVTSAAETTVPTSKAETAAQSEAGGETAQASSSDRAFYFDVIDRMRSHPEDFIVYVRDGLYERSSWTKNGEEKQGIYRETTQRSYDRMMNTDGSSRNTELDPTPVIEFVKLLDSQNCTWRAYYQDPVILSDTVPEMQDLGVYFETQPHGEISDTDVRIRFSVDEYDSKLLTVSAMFMKQNGKPLDVNMIQFFVERNDPAFQIPATGVCVGGINWMSLEEDPGTLSVLTPSLPSSFRTDNADTVYAGSIADINTLKLNYGGSRIEQRAEISLTVDHENNKLIIDTDICDSTPTDAPITLMGAVLVPMTAGTGITEYIRDGEKLELTDPLICITDPYNPPDVTETFGEVSHNKHHYELTYDGDINKLDSVSLANFYDTVVPYEDDGLPECYGGGLIIRFEDDPMNDRFEAMG